MFKLHQVSSTKFCRSHLHSTSPVCMRGRCCVIVDGKAKKELDILTKEVNAAQKALCTEHTNRYQVIGDLENEKNAELKVAEKN